MIDGAYKFLARQAGADLNKLGVSESTTSTVSKTFLGVYLKPIPTHREFYVLGNMGSRKASWKAKIKNKNTFRPPITEVEAPTRTFPGISHFWGWPQVITMTTLFENHYVRGEDAFLLEMTVSESYDNASIIPASTPSYAFDLAGQLVDSAGGDVVFVVCNETGSPQKLYASKQILALNSEYFAHRFSPEWTSMPAPKHKLDSACKHRNPHVDGEQGSSESISEIKEAHSSNPKDHRLVIHMDDPADEIDFVTLHNILYYLYTGCVNLRVGGAEYPPNKTSHPPGYPDAPGALQLYKNAKKYLLSSLSAYCLRYLRATLTPSNVAERLFCEDGEVLRHDEIRDLYPEYLLTKYEKVKKSYGWQRVVRDELEVDVSIREAHRSLLLDITQKLTYVPPTEVPPRETSSTPVLQ